MAVQPGPTFKRYAANGAATVYTIPFLLLDPANLQITLNGVSVTSGFTLAGLGNASSSCTFAIAPVGDLLFQQVMQFQRLTDYQMNGDFLSQTVNGDYDRLWLAIKQLNRDDGRALAVSPLEPEGIPALPVKALRNLKLLAFDAAGNPAPSNLTLTQLEQQPALALASAAEAKTFADEASESADRSGELASQSSDFAVAADSAATLAQSAASVASAISNSFPNAANGLAATAGSGAENRFFSVPVTGTSLAILYRNDAGVATEIGRAPSSKSIEDLSEDYRSTIVKRDSNRSLYWGGVVSKSGMVGVAFRKTDGYPIFADGRDLLGDVSNLRAMVSLVSLPRSGVLLGFATPSGRLLAHFDAHTGAWMTGGRNALSEIDQTNLRLKSVEKAIGNPLADFPIADWACWGDSLTAEGSSGNWAIKLAAALGVNVYNGGWGGQAFRQIAARQGATPSLMTVVGGTIPASGAIAVTTNAYYPASNGGSVSGTLSGVPGTYTRAADGLSATFTRTASGNPVVSPVNAVFAPLYGTTMRDRHVVLWSGANSVYYEADQYDIIASIRPMIDYLTPRVKRVIVMEVPPSSSRTLPAAPGSEREKLDNFNAMLKAAFPEYFLDIASWLRTPAAATAAGITFTAQDLIDIANGVTPSSFTTDGLHFSDAGGRAIAYRVKQEAITRGWIA